jgi:hypothetical protein
MAATVGCHFQIETSGTRFPHKPAATATMYTVEIIVVDNANNKQITHPKLIVLGGQKATMEITDKDGQTISVDVFIKEHGQHKTGTLSYSIHSEDRKVSGQFHIPVGEPTHLQTGDFTLDATITPQPAKQ